MPSPLSTSGRPRSRMLLNADSRIGRNTASFARLSAMNFGNAAASRGDNRAISAIIRSTSPVAAIFAPSSKTRLYCGSSRISSTSSASRRPHAAKMSASTRGYKKKVGPVSKRNVPRSVLAVIVDDRPPNTPRASCSVTSRPAFANSIAVARPPGPPPMIPIRLLIRTTYLQRFGAACQTLTPSRRPG